ncbi:MAG TPA: aspartoacylase [Allocoleopsis sp.]
MGSQHRIRRVAIIGGTHGNELTGIYVIKKLQQFPDLMQRSSFDSFTVFGNPKAFAAVRRYVDTDLNRCFLHQDLQQNHPATYEEKRAQEIYRLLVEQNQVDVILDLHTTTANMGQTLIVANTSPFNLKLAAHLTAQDPAMRVLSWAKAEHTDSSLKSLCEIGFSLEIGAVPQGVLDATCFQQTESLLYAILDYLEAYNQNRLFTDPKLFTLYQFIKAIDYPRNEQNEMQAMIHPQLQGKDYQPLHPGDPVFLTFDYQTIVYEGDSIVYPVFINEAAYYEKGIAFCLTEQKQITV